METLEAILTAILVDGYNEVKANGVYNASSTPDFDYSRVVEGGNRFVNYFRNPIILGTTVTTLPVISAHSSDTIAYKHGDTTTLYKYKYYNDADGYYTDALCCFMSTEMGMYHIVTDYATTFSNSTTYYKKSEIQNSAVFIRHLFVNYEGGDLRVLGETDMVYVYKCVKVNKFNNIEDTIYKVKETDERDFTRINNTYNPSSIRAQYNYTLR